MTAADSLTDGGGWRGGEVRDDLPRPSVQVDDLFRVSGESSTVRELEHRSSGLSGYPNRLDRTISFPFFR